MSQQWQNLKALVVLHKMRRKHFHPMYAVSTPPLNKRRSAPPPAARRNAKRRQVVRRPLSWLWRPLGCCFVPGWWNRNGKHKLYQQRAASPDKTALMSFEEHEDSDPYIFTSRSADSDYAAAAAAAPQDGFPFWEPLPNDGYSPVMQPSRTFDAAESGSTKEEEDRLRLSLQTLLKSSRYRSMDAGGARSLPTEEEGDDACSHHFSTSTEPPRTTFNTKVRVTESSSVVAGHPSSDARSVNTTRSNRTRGSRVSLEQFMEREHDSSYSTTARNLGEIPANDSASTNSAYLAVSYDDGDYPQLVLQPSVDGSRMSSTIGSCGGGGGNHLGATYPHPASGTRSVSSYDTAKKNTSCTPRWLDENIDMVWRQIDGLQGEEDEDDDVGVTSGEGEDGATDDDDDASTHGESTFSSLTNPNKESSKDDWVDDAEAAWSFSPEVSVSKSISDMIDKGVIQPMLTPICQFVDATEIPETLSVPHRRPLTESGANVGTSEEA